MMIFSEINKDWRIEKMEWTRLTGERPRIAGSNARLGVHGKQVPLDFVRITIGKIQGFGWSHISKEKAEKLVGLSVEDIFTAEGKVKPALYELEFPLLDWLGVAMQKPVYEIISKEKITDLKVPCYDTSIYFNDLDCKSDEEAVNLVQSYVKEGLQQGHRAFKLKVGRGAMHMPVDKGMKRDIAIINGVRDIVDEDVSIMIDANNGLNLNLTKDLLLKTKDANLTWVEEPFHEDPEYLKELKSWLRKQELDIMVVDGEGEAATPIVKWAKEGYLDAIQYDIRSYGFHRWLELGRELDKANVKTAPHNYGGSYGNYVLGHLAPCIEGFLFIEWDEMEIEGIDDSGYVIKDGKATIPNKPGFGLTLDHLLFDEMVKAKGWSVEFNHNYMMNTKS